MVRGVGRIVRASGCYICQKSLLRTFTSISCAPWHATQSQPREAIHLSKKPSRSFSNIHWQAALQSAGAEDVSKQSLNDGGKEISDPDAPSIVPWYLEVDRPRRPLQPLSERQQIPELPESSPEILQPLLQQSSIDLGLDDLSLIDLRKLDPPPALGSNLIMIIGTARSEKHLHVSADRLCRWLRSEYKLRPDADGLLGRNELKLKMKRKNRRAKLLGSGSLDEDMDDGVRTGWVCVNLGRVESLSGAGKLREKGDGFVGFGRQTEGTRIVVQMLVEEKREELDLERLWNGVSKRQQTLCLDSDAKTLDDSEGQLDCNSSSELTSQLQASSRTNIATSSSSFPTYSRGIHTSSRRLLATAGTSDPKSKPYDVTPQIVNQSSKIDTASYQRQVVLLLESGDYDAAWNVVNAISWKETALQKSAWKIEQFRAIQKRMNSNLTESMEQLGLDSMDRSSTPLLRYVYETMSSYPSRLEWEFLIWLQCFARKIGHTGYTLKDLSTHFKQMRLSGIIISNEAYLIILRTILCPQGNSKYALVAQALDDAEMREALLVLEDMFNRTGNIMTEDVFVILLESLSVYPEPDLITKHAIHLSDAATSTFDLPVLEQSPIQERLTTLMKVLPVQITRDESRICLMNIFARQHDWMSFWHVWRSVAQKEQPRSADLYAYMFKRVAETGHQKACINVLRTWIPEMDSEEPPVNLQGDVLVGVRACLAVADPLADMDKVMILDTKGEWIGLWRRCLKASS